MVGKDDKQIICRNHRDIESLRSQIRYHDRQADYCRQQISKLYKQIHDLEEGI